MLEPTIPPDHGKPAFPVASGEPCGLCNKCAERSMAEGSLQSMLTTLPAQLEIHMRRHTPPYREPADFTIL